MNKKTKNNKKSISLLLATAITFSSLISVNTYASESSSKLSLERIYGKDRYQTSINILEKMDTNKVYLTNGNIFADALSVGPLAGKENAAIVLSDGKTVDVDKLKSKSITEITIVGGKNSISNNLENNLKKNFKVSRIAGKDRYETSLKIVEKMGVNNIAIATGRDFPDALSAGAYLSQKGMPLLLVDGPLAGNIPQKYNVVYTFGGVNSIKKTFGKRISGKDRYETSMQIAKEFGSFDTAVLASGRVFADALASTPLAKKLHAPILLTNGNDISNEIYKFQGLKKVVLVGGEKSLSKELEKKFLNHNKTEESKEGTKTPNKTDNKNSQNPQNNIDNSKEVNIKKLKVVSSIKIKNTETSLEKGKSLKLIATVEGENLKDVDKKVKFEIKGNNSPNTSIDEDGLLTIAGNETSTKIIVKATSVVDNTKSITKEITVTSPNRDISTKLKMGNSKSIDIDKNNEDVKQWLKALEEGKATALKGQEKLEKLPYKFGEKRLGYYAGEYGTYKYTGLVIFGLNNEDKVIVKVPGFEDVEVKVVYYNNATNYKLEIVQKNN